MPNVGITGNFDAVKHKLALTKQQIINATKAGMRAGMHEINQIQVRTQMRGRPGLNMRHGGGAGLSGSWFVREIHGLSDSVYRLATRSKYAAVHQYGGTIRPKHAGALAVPVSPQAQDKGPREFNDLVMVSRPGHPPLLIRKRRRGEVKGLAGSGEGQIYREDIMFVLKKSVNMPKRLHLLEHFKSQGRQIILQNILRQMKKIAAPKGTK
jgi:phage gpG-like protein